MNSHTNQHRSILRRIARRAMIERGLLPDFSPEAVAELSALSDSVSQDDKNVRDLTGLLWTSIDNDDSRDLDQLTVADSAPDGKVRIFVAVADVATLVRQNSEIDRHAHHNTTSVYTPAEIFPMLPEDLSTNLTSLNFNETRLAVVVEFVVDAGGSVLSSDLYQARVHNHAKLAYDSVAAWLDGSGAIPAALASVKGLDENLRLQDKTAQLMKNFRHQHGALNFETISAKPLFVGDQIRDIQADQRNRARDIIEDFMIAANGVTAGYLAARQFPSLRRVVRTPKRWERIVAIAGEHGFKLPNDPDSKALADFLAKEKSANPAEFSDLSLSIIKLLGSGEYVAELPGATPPGHFGLAVKDYTHSTAPNRRYPDLITQRLIKAALSGSPLPYSNTDLEALAHHCTVQEDAANKVERQLTKTAAALLLESRIGEQFDAIVTGSSSKGTWVRIFQPPVEGKLSNDSGAFDVGQAFRVQLVHVDVERGYIDFETV